MIYDVIAEVRHNKPTRLLAVAFTVLFNGLFAFSVIDVMFGSGVITSDPNATASDEALIMLGGVIMLLIIPWLGLAQILIFRIRLTYEGILKTAPLTGSVFIRYEEIRHIGYGYWLGWFVIRGTGRRIFIAPTVEGLESFVEALWKTASERRLLDAARGGILSMKYASALGWNLSFIIESFDDAIKEAIQAETVKEEDLASSKNQLDKFSKRMKVHSPPRMLVAAALLIFSAGVLSAWPWLDMLFDPEYESLYYANLTPEGWLGFIVLMTLALMGFVAFKMIIDRRFWASIITASMACVGVGAILGIPAVILIILSGKHFRKDDASILRITESGWRRRALGRDLEAFWEIRYPLKIRAMRSELRSALLRYGIQMTEVQEALSDFDKELEFLMEDIQACVLELRKKEADSPEIKGELSAVADRLLQYYELFKTYEQSAGLNPMSAQSQSG